MTSPLISVAQLADRLAHPQEGAPIVVVDCRFNLADTQAGQTAWQRAHIPGARHADLDEDLSGAQTGRNGRHPLPDASTFAQTLQRWGIGEQTTVVAYDDAGGMFAARLWWMLTHWWGHARCAVLDGGWQQWTAQGRPTASAASASPASGSTIGHPQPRARPEEVILCEEVLASIGDPGRLLLIDARAPDRFRGENETLDPVGGHIPGAVNRFFKDNLDASGCFKPPGRLREEFTALIGAQPLRSCIHQCGSGVTACHNLLAMDVAGLTGSRLYAGSWSEWCAEPSRPVAR
ncbi:MAG: sulfurtransferase [Acidobacteriota bacterium]